MEELKSLVQVFSSLIPHAQRRLRHSVESSLAVSRRNLREVGNFRTIQRAACSLYDAFGNACNTHIAHDVRLSLQPCLNSTSTQVQFSVAFNAPVTSKSRSKCHNVWINIESIIKHTAAHGDKACGPSTEIRVSHKRQYSSDEHEALGKARKHVEFESLPPQISPTYSSVPDSLPNLCLQRNFCSVIQEYLQQQAPACRACIGLLEEGRMCRHLVYIEHSTNSIGSSTSLSKLISRPEGDFEKRLSLHERIRIAKYLATAVLYYHSIPWLNESWRSDDVHFFHDEGSPRYLQEITRPALPYMNASVRGRNSPGLSKSSSSDDHYIIRNRILFSLGVIFLELAFEAPLKNLQHPTDLSPGETELLTQYVTAMRLSKRTSSRVCKSYQEVVEKCLQCDFGCGNDFNSTTLQEAFYRSVIGELGRLEKLFEDLQLDDRKLSAESPNMIHNSFVSKIS
jgi:hypothetical protein